MKKKQYDEIMVSLGPWVLKEGLCRFCYIGRICPFSRRGTEICPNDDYRFTAERDCFHLWIASTDLENLRFNEGYDHPDDHPSLHQELEEDYPEESYLFHSKLSKIGANDDIPKEIFILDVLSNCA